MNLQRESALGLSLAILLLGGIAFDAAVGEADAGRVPVAPSIFDERSVYCPPPPRAGESEQKLVVATRTGEAVPVGEADEDQVDLEEGRILVRPGSDSTALVGFGEEIVASAMTRFSGKVPGFGAARCSKTASDRWYFAEGSSALGADERIVIYNPFPDEAVVGISLITPEGQQGNANLSDGIAVPAGETTVIELNEFIRQNRAVAAVVVANRGRVIAWRALQEDTEGRPTGVQLTLGAAAVSSQWFFPEGIVDDDTDMRLALLNPTDEEAIASISLASDDRSVQPPELVEVVVPPQTLRRLAPRNFVGGRDRNMGGAGLIVRTTSGRLIAERTVYYDSDGRRGITSEMGAARGSAGWYVGPPVEKPTSDEVVLLNPGAAAVTASLTLLTEGEGPTQPGPLQDLTVEAGTHLKVDLGRWTEGGAYSVRVEADGDVVAERVARQGSDMASLMGAPLVRPSAP